MSNDIIKQRLIQIIANKTNEFELTPENKKALKDEYTSLYQDSKFKDVTLAIQTLHTCIYKRNEYPLYVEMNKTITEKYAGIKLNKNKFKEIHRLLCDTYRSQHDKYNISCATIDKIAIAVFADNINTNDDENFDYFNILDTDNDIYYANIEKDTHTCKVNAMRSLLNTIYLHQSKYIPSHSCPKFQSINLIDEWCKLNDCLPINIIEAINTLYTSKINDVLYEVIEIHPKYETIINNIHEDLKSFSYNIYNDDIITIVNEITNSKKSINQYIKNRIIRSFINQVRQIIRDSDINHKDVVTKMFETIFTEYNMESLYFDECIVVECKTDDIIDKLVSKIPNNEYVKMYNIANDSLIQKSRRKTSRK